MLNNFAFFGMTGVSALVFIVVVLAILVFEIAMFISVIRNKYVTSNIKALWILGMLLIHPFVAIAYYFTDYKKTA